MNQAEAAQLKSLVQDALRTANSTTDALQAAQAREIADKAMQKLEAMQGGGMPIQSASSSSLLESGPVVGAVKGVAGLLSAPYEIPALAATGLEAGAKMLGFEDADLTPEWLKPGAAYEFFAGEYAYKQSSGAVSELLENVAEAGVEMAPALAAGPQAYLAAVAIETTRKQLADVVRPYGSSGELAAMTIELAPISPTQIAATTGIKPKADRLRPTSTKDRENLEKKVIEQQEAAIGKQNIPEYRQAKGLGIQLTTGQASGDRKQLALENTLRGSEAGGVIVDLDAENANKVVQYVTKAYDLSEVKALDGKDLQDALVANYETYKNAVQADFKRRTSEKFANLPDDVTFDMSPVIAKVDELITEWKLPESGVPTEGDKVHNALLRLKDSLSNTETKTVVRYQRDPSTGVRKPVRTEVKIPGSARQLTPAEVQKHLQDIGKMAFTGADPRFAGVDAGYTRAIGKQLGKSMKDVLNTASSQGDLAARQLTEARQYYDRALKDMQVWGDIPFIKFMDGPVASMNSADIVKRIKTVGDRDMPHVVAILSKERPDLIPQIRKSLMEDMFEANKKTVKGTGTAMIDTYDVRGVMDGLKNLEQNEFFKNLPNGDKTLNQMKALVPTVERLLSQEGIKAKVGEPNRLNKLARMNSEIQGVLFGTPGRYTAQVLERGVETVITILSDPRGLAMAAVSPELTPVVRKLLRSAESPKLKTGKAIPQDLKLSKTELRKIDAFITAYRSQLAADIARFGAQSQEPETLQ